METPLLPACGHFDDFLMKRFTQKKDMFDEDLLGGSSHGL